MGIIYLAGQRPGAGVTSIATALATSWRRAGRRVAVVKPVALAEDLDASFYARTFGSPNDASALLTSANRDETIEAARNRVAELDALHDVVIVEGLPCTDADGNPVPESPTLAEQRDAKVLGVVPYAPSLATDDAAHWRDDFASSLMGVIVNRRTRYGEHDATHRLAPAFEDAGVPVHGILPEERLLLAPTVRQIVDLLGGTYYAGSDHGDDLVEHFLIGGLITEWGGNYFDRLPHQAVLVRGGRMDIQMAALGFPMTCLILTGCERPPQYVQQRARDLDVPLVTVTHDTHAAAALLERIERQVTIDHPDKIAHLTSLVEQAVDLEAIGGTAWVRTA